MFFHYSFPPTHTQTGLACEWSLPLLPLCVCLCHQCCKFIQNPLSFSVALEVCVRSCNQYVLCPPSLQDAFISMVSVYASQLITAFFLVTFNSLELLTCLAYFYTYFPLIPKWKENKYWQCFLSLIMHPRFCVKKILRFKRQLKDNEKLYFKKALRVLSEKASSVVRENEGSDGHMVYVYGTHGLRVCNTWLYVTWGFL